MKTKIYLALLATAILAVVGVRAATSDAAASSCCSTGSDCCGAGACCVK